LAPEGVRGALKLQAQPNGRSKLVDAKRFFAHRGRAVDKTRGLEVEDFGGGITGFRLPEEGAEAEAKSAKVTGAQRRAASG
jgi:hypothetical protein